MRSPKQVRRLGKRARPNAAACKRRVYRKFIASFKAWQQTAVFTEARNQRKEVVLVPLHVEKEAKKRSEEELAQRLHDRQQRRADRALASTSAQLSKTKKRQDKTENKLTKQQLEPKRKGKKQYDVAQKIESVKAPKAAKAVVAAPKNKVEKKGGDTGVQKEKMEKVKVAAQETKPKGKVSGEKVVSVKSGTGEEDKKKAKGGDAKKATAITGKSAAPTKSLGVSDEVTAVSGNSTTKTDAKTQSTEPSYSLKEATAKGGDTISDAKSTKTIHPKTASSVASPVGNEPWDMLEEATATAGTKVTGKQSAKSLSEVKTSTANSSNGKTLFVSSTQLNTASTVRSSEGNGAVGTLNELRAAQPVQSSGGKTASTIQSSAKNAASPVPNLVEKTTSSVQNTNGNIISMIQSSAGKSPSYEQSSEIRTESTVLSLGGTTAPIVQCSGGDTSSTAKSSTGGIASIVQILGGNTLSSVESSILNTAPTLESSALNTASTVESSGGKSAVLNTASTMESSGLKTASTMQSSGGNTASTVQSSISTSALLKSGGRTASTAESSGGKTAATPPSSVLNTASTLESSVGKSNGDSIQEMTAVTDTDSTAKSISFSLQEQQTMSSDANSLTQPTMTTVNEQGTASTLGSSERPEWDSVEETIDEGKETLKYVGDVHVMSDTSSRMKPTTDTLKEPRTDSTVKSLNGKTSTQESTTSRTSEGEWCYLGEGYIPTESEQTARTYISSDFSDSTAPNTRTAELYSGKVDGPRVWKGTDSSLSEMTASSGTYTGSSGMCTAQKISGEFEEDTQDTDSNLYKTDSSEVGGNNTTCMSGSADEVSSATILKEVSMDVKRMSREHRELLSQTPLNLTLSTRNYEAEIKTSDDGSEHPLTTGSVSFNPPRNERPERPRDRYYKLLPRDIQFCVRMIERYGDDYEAMVNDEGNMYNDTAKGIARKIRIFKESSQYEVYLKNKEGSDQVVNEAKP